MEKPLSLLMKEFNNNISDVVTNSGLPIYIIEVMLRNFYKEIADASVSVSLQQEKQYRDELLKENNNEKENKK